MRIALIGYGKMGQAIEEIALERNHEIVLKITIDNLEDYTDTNLKKADIAVEFTHPEAAFDNIKRCLELGLPVVSGTTGWLHRYAEATAICEQQQGALLVASNFSIGVNIFFEVNKRLADLMSKHSDYEVSLEEIHHTQKKDAPSGTAITLAEQILERIDRKKKWVNHLSDNVDELEIISERIDPAPGTHKVKYQSSIDDIDIIHTAHNRKGFAAGAVLAAEYIVSRKGVFTMKDVLGL
ncbi:MAG TPA: 4-hydroxy-tetrahydrodipicolinate reductase [Chitinophagaceae bacterium]|nr:4-hydroxy-tetrahydrodipicolinate reductase [Chitinophagaceae bacterium]